MALERHDGNNRDQYSSIRAAQVFTHGIIKSAHDWKKKTRKNNNNLIFRVTVSWFCLLIRASPLQKYFIYLHKTKRTHRLYNIAKVHVIRLSPSLYFYRLHPPGLPQAVTAVSGKLILAKYVHSENEKEEEEHVFLFFFFFFFVGHLRQGEGGCWGRRGGSVAKIARQWQQCWESEKNYINMLHETRIMWVLGISRRHPNTVWL